jgi:hypothetical protein
MAALTRDEHLAWCKTRALEYVAAGDLQQAVASMASDLKTHPDTDNPALNGLAMIGIMYVGDGDKAAVQRWANGFDERGREAAKAVPTIDLPDDQLPAVTAAIRDVIEGDRYPRAPRLDPLRAALTRFDEASKPALEAPPPAKADKRARR